MRSVVVAVACLLLSVRPAAAADAKALYPLLAEDATFVGALDLARVRDTASFAALVQSTGAKLDETAARFGLDLRKDVDTVLFGGTPDAVVMVISAHLSAAQKKQLAQGTATKHRGVTYWTSTDGELAWLGKRLVITTAGGMPAVIDRWKKKAPSMARAAGAADLREAVAMTNTRHHLWIAMTGEVFGNGALPVGGIELVAAAASLGTDIALDVRARAATADAAVNMETLVTQALPQLKDAMKSIGLAGAAASVAVERDDRILALTASIPGDELAAVLSLLGR